MRHLKAGLVGLLISASAAVVALADGIKGGAAAVRQGRGQIALVSYLSQGDYFEAYEAGVARQAKALGVDLHIFQGKQDAALQREQIEQAIALGVQGIIVSHGQPEAVKDVIQKAVDAGIKVVVKDIDVGNPKVPLISQSDHDIARQAALVGWQEKVPQTTLFCEGLQLLNNRVDGPRSEPLGLLIEAPLVRIDVLRHKALNAPRQLATAFALSDVHA